MTYGSDLVTEQAPRPAGNVVEGEHLRALDTADGLHGLCERAAAHGDGFDAVVFKGLGEDGAGAAAHAG